MPAPGAAFVAGEVSLLWTNETHKLEGRPTVKLALATGDDATARIRWNRVHEQAEALVLMGQVLAAEKGRRGRERKAVQQVPAGTVATQARHAILAEHDGTWVDPTFTSPLTGVVVRLMRNASRAVSLDDARRFTDDLRLREAKVALASCRPGMLDQEIGESEVTDPRLVAAIEDLAAGRVARLTPEQNAALTAACTEPTIPSELARRTVNAKGLGAPSAALTVAHKLGHITVDPCIGMGLTITEADVVKREPYSLEDLRRIASTSVYMAPIDIPVAGCGPAAHWLPLLALFTGARLEELGRLLVGDVKQVEGVWCIHVTDLPSEEDAADREMLWGEKEPEKSVNTAAARRHVPVHDELVRCGLLDFVAGRGRDGFRRLSPQLKAYRGRTTEAWSSFSAWHTDEHVTDSPRKAFHSFRHLSVARRRSAGVDRNVIESLVEYASRDVTAGYGAVDGALFSVAVLHVALGTVRVDGLDLSHLHRSEALQAA